MPQVMFTAHLRRLAPKSPVEVAGGTVADALSAVFAEHPLLGSYVLDDQRRLRRHIALFVDGERAALADPVGPDAKIAVLQALVESLWHQDLRRLWFGGGYDAPGIHSILPDPADPQRLVVGVSCGGVWLSPDAGGEWEIGGVGLDADYMPDQRRQDLAVQDPHRIARGAAVPTRMWMQHHSGVYRSDDAGRTWVRLRDLPLSDFDFAVAAHPTDPDVAWFVPAESGQIRIPRDGRLCVTRTRDGGKSFEQFDAGLPAPPAFDLVYRHGLAAAPDGRSLAMGSTTGGLWTSGDAGENWHLAHAHLPPIASVQFAV